ncbi:hypothetical protein Poly24_33270 [Rosistilla carotiformis]|uniref:Uncharacterized protein n=1 Tax=Rosistilla carotiformis TaxID=2528017 RepID=A0A518JVP5_9BACT|nr:hypothetical protein [Rosistilla carotiformis]QDV69611.1 hypothetical protein Poly24_33270 [Rosistilla carotiformis]
MSSPRTSVRVEGLIHRGERCMGPIKLPLGPAEQFLEEFNRLYGGIELRVEAAAAEQPPETCGGGN